MLTGYRLSVSSPGDWITCFPKLETTFSIPRHSIGRIEGDWVAAPDAIED